MAGKKRRRREERPTIHPRNKYSENPPDFDLLASLYPSFKPYVFYSRDGRPRIDWTDFNATRELTRVLLLHDHGLIWWIPDGQLCPTVPNRSNYIHWIEDLLSSAVILKTINDGDNARGFDIGTGANCIYPLLGASLQGWSFVGSDVTDVALEWAEKNVASNPQISQLIDIRKVESCQNTIPVPKSSDVETSTDGSVFGSDVHVNEETDKPSSMSSSEDKSYQGPPILLGVVKDGEMFDFCMCNPPFFEKMAEAGLNPRTSCGGTPEEMVCPGGEKAFIIRIIEDSIALKQTFRWYTSMVGRKSNLKFLISKLREVGVTIVKTTEFVQGQTSRWGLAWSFVPPSRKLIFPHVAEKKNLSFMLEGVQRQFNAADVLQSIKAFFAASGASCKLDASLFSIDITAPGDHCMEVLKNETHRVNQETLDDSSLQDSNSICFRVLVFEQIRGTLLVKGSLQQRDSPIPGVFSAIFHQLEEDLRYKFCRHKATNNHI